MGSVEVRGKVVSTPDRAPGIVVHCDIQPPRELTRADESPSVEHEGGRMVYSPSVVSGDRAPEGAVSGTIALGTFDPEADVVVEVGGPDEPPGSTTSLGESRRDSTPLTNTRSGSAWTAT